MGTATFDPVAYKQTTHDQWQRAARAWHEWGAVIDTWLGEATETMLDLTDVRSGARVLDVAAGAGGQTFTAARRVGPEGRVLATDIAAELLAHLDRDAKAAGLSNVSSRVVDGEDLDVDEGQFDAVISRVGLIYFPDQQRALAGMRRALRSGGRVGAIVYSTPAANPFFSLPVSIIRTAAALPPPLPGQPGPFSLGAPGVLEQTLAEAGFVDIVVRTVPSPLQLPSAAECVRFERESFGALHQMLAGLDEDRREDVWTEIGEALAQFDGPSGFSGPCEMLVAAGTKP